MDLVIRLLNEGAESHTKDRSGRTPRDSAGNKDIQVFIDRCPVLIIILYGLYRQMTGSYGD